MISQYVVVEGAFDKFLLEHILPEDLVAHSEILVGNGENVALSKASSLLISSPLPVVLVVSANTTDYTSMEEKKDFMEQYLQQVSTPEHFHVLLVTPEIESIFFSSRTVVETLINRKVTDLQWELAQYCPKKVLRELLQTDNVQTSLQPLLTPKLLKTLRKTEIVQEIINSCRVPDFA